MFATYHVYTYCWLPKYGISFFGWHPIQPGCAPPMVLGWQLAFLVTFHNAFLVPRDLRFFWPRQDPLFRLLEIHVTLCLLEVALLSLLCPSSGLLYTSCRSAPNLWRTPPLVSLHCCSSSSGSGCNMVAASQQLTSWGSRQLQCLKGSLMVHVSVMQPWLRHA